MAQNIHHKELYDAKCVQSVARTFLCYARALCFPMLTALNGIGTTQAKPTENALQEKQQLIDYAATYSNV